MHIGEPEQSLKFLAKIFGRVIAAKCSETILIISLHLHMKELDFLIFLNARSDKTPASKHARMFQSKFMLVSKVMKR